MQCIHVCVYFTSLIPIFFVTRTDEFRKKKNREIRESLLEQQRDTRIRMIKYVLLERERERMRESEQETPTSLQQTAATVKKE